MRNLKDVGATKTLSPIKIDPSELVDRIRRGHPGALEQLYNIANNFSRFLMRQLGRDEVQDKVHDVFLTAAQAIVSGKLRDPERLIPFVTTLTRFYTYSQIDRRTRLRKFEALDHTHIPDTRVNLEQMTYKNQRMTLVQQVLRSMKKRDRDLLVRFYIKEQTKEEICREMKLTPTQFRLFKSKAKSRFAELGALQLRSANRVPAAVLQMPDRRRSSAVSAA